MNGALVQRSSRGVSSPQSELEVTTGPQEVSDHSFHQQLSYRFEWETAYPHPILGLNHGRGLHQDLGEILNARVSHAGAHSSFLEWTIILVRIKQ